MATSQEMEKNNFFTLYGDYERTVHALISIFVKKEDQRTAVTLS